MIPTIHTDPYAALAEDPAVLKAEKVLGYYETDELCRLRYACKALPEITGAKSPVIVEVGVEYGRSASILLHTPNARFLLIDARVVNATKGRAHFLKMLQDLGCEITNIVEEYAFQFSTPWGGEGWMLEMMSEDVIPQCSAHPLLRFALEPIVLPGEGIDLLHIDADHSYEGVKNDCMTWLPYLKQHGVAFFHDYDRRGADPADEVFPGVKRAVDGAEKAFKLTSLGLVNTQKALGRIR